jgi:hypothetical protein
MQPHLGALTHNADANLALAAMLDGTPALQPALLNKRARWVLALVPHIVRRLTGPVGTQELRPVLVSSALACLNVAVDQWARTGGSKPIGKLLDTAIAAVRS